MGKDIGLKIKQLNNLLTKKTYEIFESDGFEFISHSGFQVLEYLDSNSEKSIFQKDIENALVINRATTSKMLKSMEEKGLIARGSDNEDARAKIVKLTAKGRKYLEHNFNKKEEYDKLLESSLTKKDLEAFDRIYENLRRVLETNWES